MTTNAATVLHALFRSPRAVQDALDDLARAGWTARDLEVRSSAPLELRLPRDMLRRSRVLAATLLGALAGGLGAFLVVRFTSWDYPIVTGGMPIVSPMPTGIITYEFVALGAILATVGAVFLDAGLRPHLRDQAGPFDTALAEGTIVVAVTCRTPEQATRARAALAGADEVS